MRWSGRPRRPAPVTRGVRRRRFDRSVRLAVLAGLLAVGLVGLTLPAPASASADAPAVAAAGKVRVKVSTYGSAAQAERLTAYVDSRRSGAPWLVYVHGGYWSRGSHRTNAGWAQRMAAHGYQVFVVDYPKAPRAVWPAQRTSVTAGIAFIRAHAAYYGIDTRRLALVGGSSGGQIAMNTAGNLPKGKKAVATVSFAGADSPWDAYLAAHDHPLTGDGDKSTQLADASTLLIGCSRFSSAACAARWVDAEATGAFGRDDGALAAWHCSDDQTIPASHSRKAVAVAKANKAVDVTVYERSCANHIIATEPGVAAEATAWLDLRLGLGTSSADWRAGRRPLG